MDDNKSWNNLSDDLDAITKKINAKINQENIVDDLKENLNNTINSTSELIKSMFEGIEATIKDDQIKTETKELFRNIADELKSTVSNLSKKIPKFNSRDISFEEE